MKEIILDNTKNKIDLENTFNCGQCFRWNKINDSYIGVVDQNVFELKYKNNDKNEIVVLVDDSTNNIDDKQIDKIKQNITSYLDLNRNYDELNSKLYNLDDEILNNALEFGKGIHILKQDKFETIISFIISASNNIPRIKRIIENISKTYGNKIVHRGEIYYSFPTYEQLKNVTIDELKQTKMGFRAKYIRDFLDKIEDKSIDLNELELIQTNELQKKLETIYGIGNKVSSCIILFAYSRFDIFPIDVWINRAVNEVYFKNQKKLNNKQILEFASNKFGNLKGLAQQYIFYYIREKVRKESKQRQEIKESKVKKI